MYGYPIGPSHQRYKLHHGPTDLSDLKGKKYMVKNRQLIEQMGLLGDMGGRPTFITEG